MTVLLNILCISHYITLLPIKEIGIHISLDTASGGTLPIHIVIICLGTNVLNATHNILNRDNKR